MNMTLTIVRYFVVATLITLASAARRTNNVVVKKKSNLRNGDVLFNRYAVAIEEQKILMVRMIANL